MSAHVNSPRVDSTEVYLQGLQQRQISTTQTAEIWNRQALRESMGSFTLFSIGVLTICIQNPAPNLLLRCGCWSIGSLVDITQVLATGRSHIYLIHCVLQHCTNVRSLLQIPAERKCGRKRKG
jgi:hypothetical protein